MREKSKMNESIFEKVFTSEGFFRKEIIGDQNNYLSKQQNNEIEHEMRVVFSGTDLANKFVFQ